MNYVSEVSWTILCPGHCRIYFEFSDYLTRFGCSFRYIQRLARICKVTETSSVVDVTERSFHDRCNFGWQINL